MQNEITISRTLFDTLDLHLRNLIDLMNRDVEDEHRIVLSKIFKMKDLLKEIGTAARMSHPNEYTAPLDKSAIEAIRSVLEKQVEQQEKLVDKANPIEKIKMLTVLLTLTKKLNRINDRLSKFKDETSPEKEEIETSPKKEEI